MKKLLLAACCVAVMLVAEACALRPRYADFVSKDTLSRLATETTGEKLTLVVLDAKTDAPLSGVKVEFGEGRNRFAGTTGADGLISIPVDKKYVDENSIITVNAPKGQGRTRLVPVPPAAAPPVVPVPEAQPVPANSPITVEANDAGSASPQRPNDP